MKNCTGIRCIMQLGKVDPATCPAVGYCQQATPPTTRADKFRAMTDEELAEYIDKHTSEAMWCKNPPLECPEGEECVKCILDWLRQEVSK